MSNRKMFDSELELAREVVSWLLADDWEVYQEVQIHTHGKVADIVAVRHGIVWIIEAKLSASLSLMEQAIYWLHEAHYVSVAIPQGRTNKVFSDYLRWKGIGILSVGIRTVIQITDPRLLRRPTHKRILKRLTEQHKTFAAAGNADGKRWTPFQQTSRNVQRRVSEEPGITLKKLIDGLEHHYATASSARSSLSKWIQGGVIEGVELRIESGKCRLYSKESA